MLLLSKTLNEGDKEKVVVTVNDEPIKQIDINYQKLINKGVSNIIKSATTDDKDVLKEIIETKVLLQEAKKNNIDIDEDEKELVRNTYSEALKESDAEIAKRIGMSNEEYIQYNIEKQIEDRVAFMVKSEILNNIAGGDVNIDDEEFNNKLNEYKNCDASKAFTLLEEAYDKYIEYLEKNSNIKAIQ